MKNKRITAIIGIYFLATACITAEQFSADRYMELKDIEERSSSSGFVRPHYDPQVLEEYKRSLERRREQMNANEIIKKRRSNNEEIIVAQMNIGKYSTDSYAEISERSIRKGGFNPPVIDRGNTPEGIELRENSVSLTPVIQNAASQSIDSSARPGEVIQHTDPNTGELTGYTLFDTAGRPMSSYDANGILVSYSNYNEEGQLIETVSLPSGPEGNFAYITKYDSKGRPESTIETTNPGVPSNIPLSPTEIGNTDEDTVTVIDNGDGTTTTISHPDENTTVKVKRDENGKFIRKVKIVKDDDGNIKHRTITRKLSKGEFIRIRKDANGEIVWRDTISKKKNGTKKITRRFADSDKTHIIKVKKKEDGTVVRKVRDEAGNFIRNVMVNYDEDGDVESRVIVTKNEDGTKTRTVKDEDGNVIRKSVIKENEDGTLSIKVYDSEGKLLRTKKVDLNYQGTGDRRAKIFDLQGNHIKSVRTKYDSDGNVKHRLVSKKIDEDTLKWIKKDPDGNIIEVIDVELSETEDGDELQIRTVRDPDGNLIRTSEVKIDRTNGTITKFARVKDASGRLMREVYSLTDREGVTSREITRYDTETGEIKAMINVPDLTGSVAYKTIYKGGQPHKTIEIPWGDAKEKNTNL